LSDSQQSVLNTAASMFVLALAIYLGPFLVILCDMSIFDDKFYFWLGEQPWGDTVIDTIEIIYKPLFDLLEYLFPNL